MYSERMIKKLVNDEPLTNLNDYICTYDIEPTEKLKRSIAITDFWVKNRCKFYKLQKQANKISKKLMNNMADNGYLLLKIKAICDGKEVTDETVFSYGVEDWKEILKVVSGIE